MIFKQLFIVFGLTSLAAIFPTSQANAATVTSFLNFETPLEFRDGSSGNSINGSIQHEIQTLNLQEIIGGTYSVEHSENLNLEPRSELWSIYVNGNNVGRLSESQGSKTNDTFTLDSTWFESVTFTESTILQLDFQEETAFNGEKIKIYSSKLTLEYKQQIQNSPTPEIPETPEPTSALLLTGGLASLWIRRKFKRAL